MFSPGAGWLTWQCLPNSLLINTARRLTARSSENGKKMVDHRCSFLYAREDHLDRGSWSLWPEIRFVIGFVHERTSGADRVSIEDAFIVLASDSAGLTTFSIDETNDRAARTRWPCGAGRTRRTGWSLLPFFPTFAFRGHLTLPASGHDQGQHNNESAKFHDYLSMAFSF
jgi:hypothetical protein